MSRLVGRNKELNLIETMIRSGRHVLLEGPVGVGKTTLALAVAEKLGRGLVRVDGDGRYTEQKLVGSFDPKLVLEQGFTKDSFIPGPLYQAMKEGKVLLLNELNRMPEMVQNVLLPALDEKKISIPALGEHSAKDGFAVVATQNPREFVGTSLLSEALMDRMEWVEVGSLSRDEEVKIVLESFTNSTPPAELMSWSGLNLVTTCVELVRMTRSHPKVKRGASIRAAISLSHVLSKDIKSAKNEDLFFEIAKSVLANRLELHTGKFSNRPYSELLDELLDELKIQLKKKP